MLAGIVVAGVGGLLLLDPNYLQPSLFAVAWGGANIGLGFLTAKSEGVTVPSSPQDPIKMVVDRGVIGSTIYLMAFSNKKLVLRRLTSGGITVLMVAVLAIAGYISAYLIGGIAGGLTAFSLQEFLTQRKRTNTKKGNLLAASAKGDLEFDYDDIERVAVTRSRLRLYLEKGVLAIVISRKYPEQMWPILQRIMPSKTREPT